MKPISTWPGACGGLAMNNSTIWTPGMNLSADAKRMRTLERRRRWAADDVDHFAAYAFSTTAGRELRQGEVHRQLQAFLSAHRYALVELPRDHGKSVQACIRVLWE